MSAPTGSDAGPWTFRGALEELKGAQKPGAGVPAYTRWVNRGAGRVLAAAAVRVGITPTALTVVSGLVSMVALVGLATLEPTPGRCATVVLGLLVAYALDSADGQVARLTRTSSKAGEWLDHVVDAARLPGFHLALGCALVLSLGQPAWAGVVCVAFALLASVWFFAQILATQMTSQSATLRDVPAQAGGRAQARDWVSFAKLPSDIGTLYLMVLLLPWPKLFLVAYVGMFLYSVVMAWVALRRRYRELTVVG